MELVVMLPAVATLAVLSIYLRSVVETRTLYTIQYVRPPVIAYAITAALRGRPLLAVMWWHVLRHRLRQRVYITLDRVSNRLTPIESHERLSQWWSHHVRTTRRLARYEAYRPRHSREALEVNLWKSDVLDIVWSVQFRTYWATWPTQFWPTIACDGSAYATVDSSTSVESYAW